MHESGGLRPHPGRQPLLPVRRGVNDNQEAAGLAGLPLALDLNRLSEVIPQLH